MSDPAPVITGDMPERLVGRCIGCMTTDWPYCGGCGADLSDEVEPVMAESDKERR